MKKFIKENKTVSIIIISILFVLIVAILVLLLRKDNKNSEPLPNDYIFEDKVVELPGTKVVTSDDLNAEQCIDDICVSNVKIYSTKTEGRIECTVTNKGEQTKSDYMRVKFGDKGVVIHYTNVNPGESIETVAQFRNGSLQDATSFTLEKLTAKEKKAIVRK